MNNHKITDLINVDQLPGNVIVLRGGTTMEILYANDATVQLFECRSQDDFALLTHGDFYEVIEAGEAEKLKKLVAMAKGHHLQTEHRVCYHVHTASGALKSIDDIGKVTTIPEFGEVVISMLIENDDKTVLLSETRDHITGLMNMGQFLRFSEDILRNADDLYTYSDNRFVFLNIRNFKSYNIQNGTEMGDQALCAVARLMKQAFPEDFLSRFSSDHFAILSNSPHVLGRVEMIVTEFNRQFSGSGLVLKAGIYQVHKKGVSASKASDLAKSACDSIRTSNHDVRMYDETLNQKLKLERYIVQNLDRAIEEGWIQVYYQPVVRILSKQICGMEALARWIDPFYGFLSPADFIPVLEENRLIHKLDFHVLRLICEGMRMRECCGEPLFPVSFNLSRLDFLVCDAFNEVEKIVRHHAIPRDMINIEVTESMVMEHPDLLKKEIEKFRGAGYQVWMDDFGSGYSSLNSLKDFEFDEIKLDMVFLRSFNEKSKTIIRTIISMAKELGVQTLAEGVETMEQYNFLRECGCEKIQGYLFGRPLPIDEGRRRLAEKEILIEGRDWRDYYDKIGSVNLLTDQAIAIMEYDGRNYHYPYMSEAFLDVWKSAGVINRDAVYEQINSPLSPLSRQLRDYLLVVQSSDDYVDLDYTIRGQYIRMHTKHLATHGEYVSYFVELSNLTQRDQASEHQEYMDRIFRLMRPMYDSIYLLNLTDNTIVNLIYGKKSSLVHYEVKEHGHALDEAREVVAEEFIYRDDRKAFREFMQKETILERIGQESRGYITRYFRTKKTNGAYVWKAHTLIYVPIRNSIIYAITYAPLDQPELVDRLKKSALFNGLDEKDSMLWQGLIESKIINLFWKDKKRRFIGANQKFLDTYGFESLADIYGKTDEDMNWHIDDGPYKSAEEEVLRYGKTFSNQIGKNIIHGIAHNILATKEPFYKDGKIEGLFGYFLNLDELFEIIGSADGIQLTDAVTGLMSTQGIMNILPDYIDGWESRRENFAVVRITSPEYHRALSTYGDRAAKLVLKKIGEIIADEAMHQATCARLFGGSFILFIRQDNKMKVANLIRNISDRMAQVHQIEEYKVTLNSEIRIYHADEFEDIQDLIQLTTVPVALENREPDVQKAIEETRLRRYQHILSGMENGNSGELAAKIKADVTEDKLVEIWSAEGEFSPEKDKSVGNMMTNIISHTFSKNDRDLLRKHLNQRQMERQLDLEGYATASVDYLRYTPSQKVYWSRLECKMLYDPMNNHQMLFVFLYNIAADQIPLFFLQRMMTQNLEKLSIHNLERDVVQAYRLLDGDVLVGTSENYVENCKKFAQKYIKPEMRDSYLWAMDMKNVLMELETAPGAYRCRFWTNWNGEMRIKTWSFAFANEEHNSIIVTRADTTGDGGDQNGKEQKMSEMSQELKRLRYDATGVLSRMTAILQIRAMVEAKKPGHYTMIMLDLDELKYINDHFGHPVGDKAIQLVADTLKAQFKRVTDIIGRIGGDEFMVVLDGGDGEFIENALQNVLDRMNRTVIDSVTGYTPHCSIGYLIVDYGSLRFEEAYDQTDRALYVAKENGKNRFNRSDKSLY